jgi:hypothetical protein
MKREKKVNDFEVHKDQLVTGKKQDQGYYLTVTTPRCSESDDPKLEAFEEVIEQLRKLWVIDPEPEIFERLTEALILRCHKEARLQELRVILKDPEEQPTMTPNRTRELFAMIDDLQSSL